MCKWDNRADGYFKNLEYFQISGHKVAAYDETAEKAATLQSQIVANINTMCTDKDNFPKLNTLNFNSNAYNEFNNGFDAALRSACDREATGVSTRAFQVAVNYPPMCSTSVADNYWYYDMMNDDEIAQCRFTWNWEMGDTINVYAPAGPFPNDSTEACIPTTQPPVEIVVVPENLVSDPLTATTLQVSGSSYNTKSDIQFTLQGLPSLRAVTIGDNSFRYTRTFVIDGLSELESVTIGNYVGTMRQNDPWDSERRDGSCRIINCPNLKSIRIGRYSFADYYDSFDLINLPSLVSIHIDQRGFNNLQLFSLASSIALVAS